MLSLCARALRRSQRGQLHHAPSWLSGSLTISSQHFQKLRRDCKAQFGEPKDAGSTSPAKKTLRKPKAAANGTTPAKSANKRKVKHDETADSVDDEDNIPSKKAKVEDGNEEDHDTPLL